MDLVITATDLLRLGILSSGIVTLLAVSEWLRRRLHLADEFTRKIVHVGTGAVIFFAPPFFPNAGAVVLIAAVFVVLNAAAYAFGVLKAVHHTTRRSFGTVYYPLALFLIALPFWNGYPDMVVAAILVMAIGDAAAGITGESLRKPALYRITADLKSLQGSAAMFVGSLAALAVTFAVYPDGGLQFGRFFAHSPFAAAAALTAIALFATGWEAASSRGLDNLTVPVLTVAALHASFASGLEAAALRFAAGTGLGLLIALLAHALGMLQRSGAVATFLLAAVVFGIGGWQWTLPIFTFFLLSSLLSQWRKNRKERFETMFEKSGRRDAGQVAANGGIVGFLALAWHFGHGESLYLLSLVAVAVVTADTWGTELGVLARQTPRSVLSGRRVPTGTSGGVTAAGTLGGMAGAVIVTAASVPFVDLPGWTYAVIVLLGVSGSLIDSLLGASLQAQYRCARCGGSTEKPEHCGAAALLQRGTRWLNNDMVNFLSTLITVLLAWVLLRSFFAP